MPSKKQPCDCTNCKGEIRDPKTIKRHAERDALIAQEAQRDAEEREIQRLALARGSMDEYMDEEEDEAYSQESQAQINELVDAGTHRPIKRRRLENSQDIHDNDHTAVRRVTKHLIQSVLL